MGSETRKRDKRITVRVTEDEAKGLKKKAESFGVSVPELMRSCALGKIVKSKLDQQNILSLLRVHADSGRLGGLLKMWLSSPESLGREGFDLDALLSEIQDNQKNMRDIIQLL
ncbi:MAG: ribbon-helix-helix protein, CopG family [Candidatus Margulisbacteria bacterium]|nr:ribbon-helix-helix protein, CopG family [Candidatus Margulisiibacteriota bacterium]